MERGFQGLASIEKVDQLYNIVKPEVASNISLPDLPDLRLIEMEAQLELSKEIPPPKMKKSFIVDSTKQRTKLRSLKGDIKETVESLKAHSNKLKRSMNLN